MKEINNQFAEMTLKELNDTNGGGAIAVIGLCIAGYGLIRLMVKEKGEHDGYYGK